MLQFAALVCVTIASAYQAGRIAHRRGRSVKTWLWLGALFGPFAVAAAALMPTRHKAPSG